MATTVFSSITRQLFDIEAYVSLWKKTSAGVAVLLVAATTPILMQRKRPAYLMRTHRS